MYQCIHTRITHQGTSQAYIPGSQEHTEDLEPAQHPFHGSAGTSLSICQSFAFTAKLCLFDSGSSESYMPASAWSLICMVVCSFASICITARSFTSFAGPFIHLLVCRPLCLHSLSCHHLHAICIPPRFACSFASTRSFICSSCLRHVHLETRGSKLT